MTKQSVKMTIESGKMTKESAKMIKGSIKMTKEVLKLQQTSGRIVTEHGQGAARSPVCAPSEFSGQSKA